jgi:hypothetical protein
MQAGERQLHLGLDASRTRHPAACGAGEDVVEERRLPDTGFATQHDCAAGPRSRIPNEPIQQFTLGMPILQS